MNDQRRLEWLFEIGQRAARLEQAGKSLGMLAFDGNQPASDDSHLLSQWAPTPFVMEGVCYRSLTHLLMAARAELAGDTGARVKILREPDPAAAERIGLAVLGASEGTWASLRSALLYRGNLCKAVQLPGVRRLLLASEDAVIAAAGVVDRELCVGLTSDDPRIARPHEWKGLNLLGFRLDGGAGAAAPRRSQTCRTKLTDERGPSIL
jgi:ribA/ribD-fused uncharacterized protein